MYIVVVAVGNSQTSIRFPVQQPYVFSFSIVQSIAACEYRFGASDYFRQSNVKLDGYCFFYFEGCEP
jgi:hypothetical protein